MAINPKYEDALYNKGYDLATLGNHTGAVEYFDKALAIDPHDIDAGQFIHVQSAEVHLFSCSRLV